MQTVSELAAVLSSRVYNGSKRRQEAEKRAVLAKIIEIRFLFPVQTGSPFFGGHFGSATDFGLTFINEIKLNSLDSRAWQPGPNSHF